MWSYTFKNFNSSVVQLKALTNADTATVTHFNSSVVQLKVAGSIVTYLQYNDFNSSVVQLKVQPAKRWRTGILNFNSSVVQLKVATNVISIDATKISIPQWYN